MKNIACVAVLFLSTSACAMESFPKVKKTKQETLNEALLKAAESGSLEDAMRLIAAGADPVNPSVQYGATPLFKAAFFGRLEVATYLLNFDALIDKLDEEHGMSPFHIACVHGYLEMVKLFACNGAAIHLPDKKGMRPIDLASRYANPDIVDFLDEFGKEVHKKIQEGKKLNFSRF